MFIIANIYHAVIIQRYLEVRAIVALVDRLLDKTLILILDLVLTSDIPARYADLFTTPANLFVHFFVRVLQFFFIVFQFLVLSSQPCYNLL